MINYNLPQLCAENCNLKVFAVPGLPIWVGSLHRLIFFTRVSDNRAYFVWRWELTIDWTHLGWCRISTRDSSLCSFQPIWEDELGEHQEAICCRGTSQILVCYCRVRNDIEIWRPWLLLEISAENDLQSPQTLLEKKKEKKKSEVLYIKRLTIKYKTRKRKSVNYLPWMHTRVTKGIYCAWSFQYM